MGLFFLAGGLVPSGIYHRSYQFTINIANSSVNRMDIDLGSKKLVDCRICHDEEEDSNMEVPCSCSGTLKV